MKVNTLVSLYSCESQTALSLDGCFPLQDVQNLSPATDFYKKLALDCSGHHVAVDLFLLSAQYCDLSSLGESLTTA